MIAQTNKYREDIEFKERDIIFLSSKNIVSTWPSRKLINKRYDLFKIIKIINNDYQLKLPVIFRIHNVFHLSLLSLAIINPLSD